MASTLLLESKVFPSSFHHNYQLFHRTQCKFSRLSIPLSRPQYNTQSNSSSLNSKKPSHINPNTASIKSSIFKHEIIVPNFSSSKQYDANMQPEKTSKTTIGLLLDAVSNSIKAVRKPMVAVVLACLLIVVHRRVNHHAWASSGGCMGGSSFSSDSSDSSSDSWDTSYDDYSSSDSNEYGGNVGAKLRWWQVVSIVVCILLFIIVLRNLQSSAVGRYSIIKTQVALLGTTKTLQSELNKIALTTDTSTSKGINYVLTETVQALLRHPDCFFSAYSSVETKSRIVDCGNLFNQMSREERGKFDEETLVNVDNIKKQTKRSANATGINTGFIVVTILVVAQGVLELPAIKGNAELKQALQKLGSIPYHKTMAAQVLWTPQVENDTLSEQQLHEDYPLLKPFEDSMQT